MTSETFERLRLPRPFSWTRISRPCPTSGAEMARCALSWEGALIRKTNFPRAKLVYLDRDVLRWMILLLSIFLLSASSRCDER